MRRLIGSSLVLLVAIAATSAAQAKPDQAGAAKKAASVAWSDLVGDWEGQSMRGTSDSVITQVTTTFTADNKVFIKFPDREPVPARVVTMGGDSVVFEAGPYPSVSRAGHQVTTRMTSHAANHKMWGTFVGKFDDGQMLEGTFKAAHKMK